MARRSGLLCAPLSDRMTARFFGQESQIIFLELGIKWYQSIHPCRNLACAHAQCCLGLNRVGTLGRCFVFGPMAPRLHLDSLVARLARLQAPKAPWKRNHVRAWIHVVILTKGRRYMVSLVTPNACQACCKSLPITISSLASTLCPMTLRPLWQR